MQDIRTPSRCKSAMRSFRVLRSVKRIFLPTLRDNLSVPFSKAELSKKNGTNRLSHKCVQCKVSVILSDFNPLKPELNLVCYLLALLAHHFLHVSRIRVKSLTLR